MIKTIEGNLFDSNANFIVHQVNCQSVMGSGVALQVKERYPHVYTEYLKFLRHHQKKKSNPLGLAQFVPVDVWALGMVDTILNRRIEPYDASYQYIVNLFGQDTYGDGLHTDLKAFEKAMRIIMEHAKAIGATVAMPYNIASCRGGADWKDVYRIIESIFASSGVDVEIYRYDMG